MAAERRQPKSVRALAKLGADGTPQTAKTRCRCIGQRQWGTWRLSKVLVEVGADTEALMTCERNGYEDRLLF